MLTEREKKFFPLLKKNCPAPDFYTWLLELNSAWQGHILEYILKEKGAYWYQDKTSLLPLFPHLIPSFVARLSDSLQLDSTVGIASLFYLLTYQNLITRHLIFIDSTDNTSPKKFLSAMRKFAQTLPITAHFAILESSPGGGRHGVFTCGTDPAGWRKILTSALSVPQFDTANIEHQLDDGFGILRIAPKYTSATPKLLSLHQDPRNIQILQL